MQPHQERVVNELRDLSDKIEKLVAFFGGDVFKSLDKQEQSRLLRQRDCMDEYANILRERIEAF